MKKPALLASPSFSTPAGSSRGLIHKRRAAASVLNKRFPIVGCSLLLRLELPRSQSIKVSRIAPYSVKVLRHGASHPSLFGKTFTAPPTGRSVVVRRAASFGFAGDASSDKAKTGRSRVGGTRFSNA
jgi:hypothetical protein